MSAHTLKLLVEQIADWPEQDQQELADYARVIEARRTGVYVLADEERSAVAEGVAQADAGEFVSNEELAAARWRHQA